MSSDDEDVVVLYYYYRRNRRKRRQWIHPYIERNLSCRMFVAAAELRETDEKFCAFYRMSKESFVELLSLVKPSIQRKNTNMRECVSVEERLMITLRYLASGCSFVSLGFYFARGDSTISKIVAETTLVIWGNLKDEYMPIPNLQEWTKISNRFYELWNLPNCLGAIDGKHIRIKKLPNSGSSNFNYKNYHSVVLMACCDADGLFTLIETGYAGRNSDGGIFRASAMKQWIESVASELPKPTKLPHDQQNNIFPHYFVADEAFPLLPYSMRPYPQRVLNNRKRIFNYRLSRGRKTIECAFGMASQKFQVLQTAIRCINLHTINNIVKCVCILHNFIRKREGTSYTSSQIPEEEQSISISHATARQQQDVMINNRTNAHNLRDYLSFYYLTPQGQIPWQWNHIL